MKSIKQIPRAGYEYQDLEGIREVLNFYENKNLYDWVALEYEDKTFKALDDVVCKIKDQNKYNIIQVKFTVDGQEYKCDWDWLTYIKKDSEKSTSLIQKWSKTIINKISFDKLNKAVVITNRQPDKIIKNCLINNKIQWHLIEDDIKTQLIKQLGSEEKCELFFSSCEFNFRTENLNDLDATLFNRFIRQVGESRAHWCFLKEEIKQYAINKKDNIDYETLERIINRKPPEKLNQDFLIPEGYIPPSITFHNNLLAKIKSREKKIIVITGSPGVGKSTYISHLTKCLDKKNIKSIRHHYYISSKEKGSSRYRCFNIQASLKEQAIELFKDFSSSNEATLNEMLKECSIQSGENPFVLIIDGLDHVWREEGSKENLNTFFNTIFPIPDNVVLIIGTQPVDNDKLPHKLIAETNRKDWLHLPFMSINSIGSYLKENNKIEIPQDYNHGKKYYSDISEAFLEVTNGHPLHLIYSIEYSLNNKLRMFPCDIKELPDCPNNDIRKYYKNLVNTIEKEGKLILKIFVASEFYGWLDGDLQQCLIDNGIDLLTAEKAYKQVSHVLHNDGYFIKEFHESIRAYVKETIDSKLKEKDSFRYIKKWLDSSARDFYKDIYAPFINAKLEDFENIYSIDREKIVNLILKGYSFDLIIWLLDKAETILFNKNKFIKVVEFRHLKTRLLNLLQFNTWNPETLLELQLRLSNNNDLKAFLLSNFKQLKNHDLLALGKQFENNQYELERVINKRIDRYIHNKNTDGEKNDIDDLIALFSISGNINRLYTHFIKNNDEINIVKLFEQSCFYKKTDQIKKLIAKNINLSPIHLYRCIVNLVKYSDLEPIREKVLRGQ